MTVTLPSPAPRLRGDCPACRAGGLALTRNGTRLPWHRDRRDPRYGIPGRTREAGPCDLSRQPVSPVITEPGVYQMGEAYYHADPVPGGSLSSTTARRLLSPSCPAKARYLLGQPFQSRPMDVGRAAHNLVLGTGSPIMVIDADDYRSRPAREAQARARAAGQAPVLRREHQVILAMAEQIAAHPLAGDLFAAAGDSQGISEASLFWQEQGWWCRARLDRMPLPGVMRRFTCFDYKTASRITTSAISRAVAEYGYHQQADWYLRGVRALRIDPDPAFVFVFQDTEAPYLVRVMQLGENEQRIARERNDWALAVWAQCMESGQWPGYGNGGIEFIHLPRWAVYQHDEEMTSDGG